MTRAKAFAPFTVIVLRMFITATTSPRVLHFSAWLSKALNSTKIYYELTVYLLNVHVYGLAQKIQNKEMKRCKVTDAWDMEHDAQKTWAVYINGKLQLMP